MTITTKKRTGNADRPGSRAASWLAWSLAILSVAMALASVTLFVARSVRAHRGLSVSSGAGDLLLLVPFLAFPVVGALIASRRPRNPIGWICLADGLLWMLIILSEDYTAYGLAVPGSAPYLVTVNALLYAWIWVPTVGLTGIFLVLLFPDGTLPSRRWRPFAWFSGAVIALESVIVFITPGPLDGLGGARNPFGLERFPWLVDAVYAGLALLPVCMLASVAGLVLRYRRSGYVVREQIKWIALAASIVGVVYLAVIGGGLISLLLSGRENTGGLGTQSVWGALLEALMVLSFAGVPMAIGFAVLKHRLYDIDFLINRALVYGSLTGTLALLYVGSVVGLQALLRAVTGQESTVTVVASTLTIAALFSPLRRRVQALVDRRFYRRKYDAAKTLEAFSSRLRDETDLEALNAELARVVEETMQPVHVSLWLRFDEESPRTLR